MKSHIKKENIKHQNKSLSLETNGKYTVQPIELFLQATTFVNAYASFLIEHC